MSKAIDVQLKDESVQATIDQVREQIAARAQQIAASRSGASNPLENWLTAEGELFWKPEVQLQESEDALIAKFRLPEVQFDDVQVYVDPQSIIIMGSKSEGLTNGTQVHYSDFRYGQIYREMNLPASVAPGKAKARLSDGVLTVTLPKPKPEAERKSPKPPARPRKAKSKKE